MRTPATPRQPVTLSGAPVSDRLDSWKEIAGYLNRDLRTVQRWEESRGLPVRRGSGQLKRSPVFAFRSELDAWLRQTRESPLEGTEPAAAVHTLAGSVPELPFSKQFAAPWKAKALFGGGLALAVLAVVAIWVLRAGPAKPTSRAPSSIAILPFSTVTSDAESELLAEGLADEILRSLARLGSVRVVARTSSFQFKGTALDVREIGRKLNVESVLEGSIGRMSGGLRVTVQLNETRTGFHLWSNTYSAGSSEILILGDRVAREIAGRLSGAPIPRAVTYSPGAKAYHAVLRGRYHLLRRTGPAIKAALAEFEEAIRLEPAYAEAHAGLAVAWFLAENYVPTPAAEAMPKAKAAAMKALSLDETLAEAHAVLANVHYSWEWDWEAAGIAFRKAVALKPSDALVRQWYGGYLLALGQFEECLRERQVTEDLDPVSPIHEVAHSLTLYYMGRYREAIERLEKVIELDPHFLRAYPILSRAYALNGDTERALRTQEKARSIFGDVESIPWVTAYVLAVAGRQEEARQKVTKTIRAQGRRPLNMAHVHVALGEHAAALDLIEEAIGQHRTTVAFLAVRPEYKPLRGNPRFEALLRRINLR
jgi:serine/threonine-protein kinase